MDWKIQDYYYYQKKRNSKNTKMTRILSNQRIVAEKKNTCGEGKQWGARKPEKNKVKRKKSKEQKLLNEGKKRLKKKENDYLTKKIRIKRTDEKKWREQYQNKTKATIKECMGRK